MPTSSPLHGLMLNNRDFNITPLSDTFLDTNISTLYLFTFFLFFVDLGRLLIG
uniref:Uncharacterized protein n=1 Tax=Uncultured archaeon GZfos26G2 TaxID=3386331 RepID=Q64C21_UNCAG|nr:hypothetical protein GZ26D6_32 [uncultured archaeon GZfos26D6]